MESKERLKQYERELSDLEKNTQREILEEMRYTRTRGEQERVRNRFERELHIRRRIILAKMYGYTEALNDVEGITSSSAPKEKQE